MRQDILLAVIKHFVEDQILDVPVLLRWSGCHSDDVSDAVLLHRVKAGSGRLSGHVDSVIDFVDILLGWALPANICLFNHMILK